MKAENQRFEYPIHALLRGESPEVSIFTNDKNRSKILIFQSDRWDLSEYDS
jgi:hypothetical protein